MLAIFIILLVWATLGWSLPDGDIQLPRAARLQPRQRPVENQNGFPQLNPQRFNTSAPPQFERIPNVTHEFLNPAFPSDFFCAIAVTYRFDPAVLTPVSQAAKASPGPPIANTTDQLGYARHTYCILVGFEDAALAGNERVRNTGPGLPIRGARPPGL